MIDATATATIRTASLTEGQWGTIRTAMICYAGDQREAGNGAWADHIMRTYASLRDQTF